jgi:hypothetical protein
VNNKSRSALLVARKNGSEAAAIVTASLTAVFVCLRYPRGVCVSRPLTAVRGSVDLARLYRRVITQKKIFPVSRFIRNI